MDRRGSLVVALGLLSALAGCQHQTTVLSPGQLTGGSPGMPAIDPSQIKKVELPKKDPPPAALVSSGDFKAGEALAADVPPLVQQLLREEARQDYQRALTIDPKCVAAYQGLARLCTAEEEPARAVETYQKALQIAPQNAALWCELGMCHNYQKNWNQALDCLGRAAQLDPGNRSYLNAMGVVLTESGRLEEGLSCFVRSSGEAMGCYRLAQTLQRLQQPELSQRYLEMALQKDPNLATTWTAQSAPGSGAAIQRMSYEAASVPPAQTMPSMPQTPAVVPASHDAPIAAATAGPAPRVIHLDGVEDKRTTPAPSPVPPPPPITLNFGE